MEHSELFLLLPRYEEAEGQPDYISMGHRTKRISLDSSYLR